MLKSTLIYQKLQAVFQYLALLNIERDQILKDLNLKLTNL